jgi:hypothetical protein
MRILHVTFMYPTPQKPLNGVAVEQLVSSIQSFAPGSSQVVLHITDKLEEDTKEKDLGNCIYYRIKPPHFFKIFHFYSAGKVIALLKGHKFDFVHFHNFFPGLFLLEDFLNSRKLPYIITFRGSCARALRFMYRLKKLRKLITGAKAYTFLSEYFYREVVGSLQKYDLTLNSHRLHFLPNFKDDKWAKDASTSTSAEPFRLLLIANVEKRKNLLNTIKAVKLAGKSRWMTLDIYGEVYDRGIFAEIENEFDKNTRFHRPVTNNELKSIIDSHHALILLAHFETFGIAYIEAILRERPIIYNENAGISGFLKGRNYGIAVTNENDIEEISGAVLKVAERYNSFDFKGKEQFTASEVMPQWLKIYTDVLH